MLKSINKLSNYYKINIESTKILTINTSTITSKTLPILFINNNYSESIFSSSSNQILNYSTKKRGTNVRRNSYTHQQDVRKIKRREARSSQNEISFEDNIKPIDSTEPIANNKPSHLHSKPITHKQKLETLEHHREKKLLRNEKYKEEQRKELINSLEQEKNENINNQNEDNDIIEDSIVDKKVKQKRQQDKLKQFGIDTLASDFTVSEGKTEYSSFTNKVEEFEDQSTFEADLSSYSGKNIKFDLSKIEAFNIEDANDITDLDDISIGEEVQEMSIQDAHKRFNFTDEELDMLNTQAREKLNNTQLGEDRDISHQNKSLKQQKQSGFNNEQKEVEEEEEEEGEEELVDEIAKYEEILKEKKRKLSEKESKKQIKLDLKQSKIEKKKLDKKLKGSQKLQKQKQDEKEEEEEKEEEDDKKIPKSNGKISSTQIDYINKQKVIEHLQELHQKKIRESKTYREKDLSPITIEEVMNYLATTHLDDFCVVDVSNKCTWANYLVIASSDSTRLLSNTEDDIIYAFKHRLEQLHSNSSNSDEWRVIDLQTVVIHLFETKTRENYDLENLWVTRRETDWKFEESWDDELTGRIEKSKEEDNDDE